MENPIKMVYICGSFFCKIIGYPVSSRNIDVFPWYSREVTKDVLNFHIGILRCMTNTLRIRVCIYI